jgi:hypothetical protein
VSYSKLLLVFCVLVANFAISGCGGTGTSSANDNGNTPEATTDTGNAYSLSEDSLGLKIANFISATNENGVFTLRVAIANSMTDPNFTDVFRINILQPDQIIAPGTFSIGADGNPSPLCEILFFNGEQSTRLNTGDLVAGTFAVQVEDDLSSTLPKADYTINGDFSFVVNFPSAIRQGPVYY